jgi:hypothetical protein
MLGEGELVGQATWELDEDPEAWKRYAGPSLDRPLLRGRCVRTKSAIQPITAIP